jgi:hypothetical protein
VAEADLLIHVLDASSPDVAAQRQAVYQVLRQLQVPEAKLRGATIEVWNKSDLLHPGTPAAMQPSRRPSQPCGPTVRSIREPQGLGFGKEGVTDPSGVEALALPGEVSEVGESGARLEGEGGKVMKSGGDESCDPLGDAPVFGGGAGVNDEEPEGEAAAGRGRTVGVKETIAAIQQNTAWEIIQVRSALDCVTGGTRLGEGFGAPLRTSHVPFSSVRLSSSRTNLLHWSGLLTGAWSLWCYISHPVMV